MSAEPKVRTSLERGVYTLTLADEENRNALSTQLVSEFLAAIDHADANEEVRVVVVTNTGRVFCAGADLSERSSDDAPDQAALKHPGNIFSRVRQSPKPFVGRIAGHAVAGGMGLAAAMDISVGLEDAKFGFTEVRIGVAPAMISVICLPKMRQAAASEAFLRGNRFLGAEAAALGLINHAVSPGELDTTVDQIVNDLLEGAPAGLAAAKRLIETVPTLGFDDAMAWTAKLSAEMFQGADAQEGMNAYLEKRPPAWSPRAG